MAKHTKLVLSSSSHVILIKNQREEEIKMPKPGVFSHFMENRDKEENRSPH